MAHVEVSTVAHVRRHVGMADAALVSMLVQSSGALPRFAKMQHGLVVR